jgi:creatinine amidohydrolase/Fe(II)-dependent formamide hydrolase-like protein
MAKAVDEVEGVPTSENIYWDLAGSGPVTFLEFFSRLTPSGVMGQATLATPEKGAEVFDAASSRLGRFLVEFREREIRPRRDLHDAATYPAR